MANISLEGSIRTCKVDTAWANKLYSDRFLNSNSMVCPVWNKMDSAGRLSCEYGFNHKTAGCHSAADRVMVENELRPRYIEYVNLDARGIRGDAHCPQANRNGHYAKGSVTCNQKALQKAQSRTGQTGMVNPSQHIIPNCAKCNKSRWSKFV